MIKPMNKKIEQLIGKMSELGLGLEAEVILCDLLKCERAKLFLMKNEFIPDEFLELCEEMFLKLKNGVPLAYIRGKKEFYGRDFIVDRGVLIPRPETEILVDLALQLLKTIDSSNVRIIEIGLGSGCISLSVLCEFLKNNNPGRSINVLGIEKSELALEVAKKNTKLFKLEKYVNFVNGDLLNGVSGHFDILVANLPYIPENSEDLDSNVRNYEPSSALFAGKNGFELYEEMLHQVASGDYNLHYMIFEIGYDQGEIAKIAVRKYFPYATVEIRKDLRGFDRVVVVCLKNNSPDSKLD